MARLGAVIIVIAITIVCSEVNVNWAITVIVICTTRAKVRAHVTDQKDIWGCIVGVKRGVNIVIELNQC